MADVSFLMSERSAKNDIEILNKDMTKLDD